jgi:hypothetical protein
MAVILVHVRKFMDIVYMVVVKAVMVGCSIK